MEQKEFEKLKVGDKVQVVSLEKLKRCPATYNFAKGAKIAFDRLFEK